MEDDAFVIDVPDSRCQQMPESSAALELKKKKKNRCVYWLFIHTCNCFLGRNRLSNYVIDPLEVFCIDL